VSITDRIASLLRSNITSLFERGEREASGGGGLRIEELSDEELERELARRRGRREKAERAADDPLMREAEEEVERATQEPGRFRTGRRSGVYGRVGGGTRPGAAAPRRDPRLAQLYAQLECPYGSDFQTVQKHYRTLMRKYHPDLHTARPEKQVIATELSQRLTQAYNELRRLLQRPPGATP
jgi:DnaJ-domain-containing protein 1